MKTRQVVPALASVFVLASCAILTGGGTPGSDCRTPKCNVDILVDARGNVTFEPDPLKVFVPDSRIVWHLPSGYEFCEEAGDGVSFKQPHSRSQFIDGYATDDGERSPDKKCKKKYHWKDKKTDAKGTRHPYGVKFRDNKGKKFDVDPIIINDM